jgi:DNA mismatch repair ATPase MutS
LKKKREEPLQKCIEIVKQTLDLSDNNSHINVMKTEYDERLQELADQLSTYRDQLDELRGRYRRKHPQIHL